ncbi:hypothetical protein GLOIN_2v1788520 [Rhizophagus clarus]|uniref:F-box domain-containing protein n=1 Tax=Rhizophagus clarus TaxID=94130 RepID=A0A8H3QZF9_9GLOM|nr:hypothetical protein GLOIN_2v1788520 [Rhizophagus clarus]
MVQGLSAECLQQIISYLEDDNRSLHSCLLVNRFWCYNTVSTLWSRPWCSYEITQTSATSLIQTYIDCLSEEAKIDLYNNGIIYRNHLKSAPPIFDYPSFLRSLNYDYMHWSISQWLISCWLYRVLNYEEEVNECQTDRIEDCIIRFAPDERFNNDEYNEIEDENERKTIIIAKELCNLFKDRCSTFHDLHLENKAIQCDGFLFLPSSTDSCNYLKNLRQLVCLGDNKSELLLAISEVCKDLRKVSIGFPLALQWKSHYESDAMSLESLLSQSKSLNFLELMYTDFREAQDYQSLALLPSCKKLKKNLIFVNEWNPLYPLIQQKFWDELFLNNANTLRKLSLWWVRSDSKDGAKIIESITKRCSKNISILHLPILWTHEILTLFDHCRHLKEFSFSGDDLDANEFLSQLGQFIPTTLRSLTIKDGHSGGWNLLRNRYILFFLVVRLNYKLWT